MFLTIKIIFPHIQKNVSVSSLVNGIEHILAVSKCVILFSPCEEVIMVLKGGSRGGPTRAVAHPSQIEKKI